VPIGAARQRRREDTLSELLDARNSQDLDRMVACFAHPRVELIGRSRVYEGADDVRGYLDSLHQAFPDLTFDVLSLYHADDAVVTELLMTGTHLGAWHDVEPSGRQFRCRAAIFFQFAADDLVGMRVYYDTTTIVRQLV
jgi:steroid delta-isomerase-like uncharacterized protein